MKEFIQLSLICVAGSILMIGSYCYFLHNICLSECAAFLITYGFIMSIAANIDIKERNNENNKK